MSRLITMLLLLALPGLAACEDEDTQPSPTSDLGADARPNLPDLPDSRPPVEAGGQTCKPVTPGPAAEIRELAAAPLIKYPTLINVTWKTPTPTRGTMLFGLTAGLEIATVSSGALATSHKVMLRGIPASSQVHYRVEASSDSGPCHSAAGKITTGALPAGLPLLTLGDHVKGEAAGGYIVFPVITQHKSWLVIVDAMGRPVWFHEDSGSVFRARLSLDRKAVVAHRGAADWGKSGAVIRIPLDGSAATETAILNSHTDFVEYAPGKYAVLGRSFRSFQGGARKLMGETIMQVDEGGTPKVFWDTFDHITPDLNRTWGKGTYTPDPDVEAWSHLNYIGYDTANKALVLTSRNLSAALAVSLATGKVLWILGGGTLSTINDNGDGSLVDHPHSVQQVSGGVLVFNNGGLSPGNCSYVAETAIKAGKASLSWTYNPSACYQITFLGEALRLSNGNTLVSWSTAGRLEEVTQTKKLVWSLRAAMGSGFGYMHRVAGLY